MANAQNGFPKLDSPMVDAGGRVTIPWYKFLIALWQRTGSASGAVSPALDSIGSTQGDVLYRGAAAWAALTPSVVGYALKTGGVGGNPSWGSVVSSVGTGAGLTGGPITTTGTISVATNGIVNNLLGQMPGQTMKGNINIGSADAADLTTTQVKTLLGYVASGDAAGGVLNGTYPNPSLGANVVGNAALAQMPADTLKGNNTAGTANAADLTTSQVGSMLFPVFSSYTPVITAAIGTFGSVSSSGWFLQLGKMIFYQVVITITTTGTAVGNLFFTLPNSANTVRAGVWGHGRENAVTGKSLTPFTQGVTNNMLVQFYDGTSPIASGYQHYLSGWLESQ